MGYPENLLVPGERVLVHRRPHVRMLVVPVLLPPLLALLVGWLAALAAPLTWRVTAWTVLAVVATTLLCWFCLAPVLRWRCTHFVVTDRRVLVREGVLSRSGISVPASTVAAVDVRQRFAERFLRCGTLLVGVDGADEPWEFEGLGDPGGTAVVLERVAIERGAELDACHPDDEDPTGEDPDEDVAGPGGALALRPRRRA